MVFNTTSITIPVILWQSVLLEEKTRVSGENHRLVASLLTNLSHNVVSCTLCLGVLKNIVLGWAEPKIHVWYCRHYINGHMHPLVFRISIFTYKPLNQLKRNLADPQHSIWFLFLSEIQSCFLIGWNFKNLYLFNHSHIGLVMFSVLASSVVDQWLKPWSA